MGIFQKIKQKRVDRAAWEEKVNKDIFDLHKAEWEEKKRKKEQEMYDQELDRRIKELLVRYLSAKLDGNDPAAHNPATTHQTL